MARKRKHSEKKWWTSSVVCYGLIYLHEAVVHAQSRRESSEESETRALPGGRRRSDAFVNRILRATGTKTWEGFDDSGELLPFGVTHEVNRRTLGLQQLKDQTSTDSFLQFPPDVNNYGIGVKKKKGSKKSGKKGTKGGNPNNPSTPYSKSAKRPTVPPPSPTPRPPTPPTCRVRVNVDFLQFSAIPPALFNDPFNPNEQELGTRYVYNDALRDQRTLDEIEGSRGSGTCTRTESRVGNDIIGLQLGRGYCQFTYTLFDGNKEITFTAAGEVVDSLGGVLSITGGTSSVIGAYGEVELLPVNLKPDGSFEVETGDFFLDPLFYLADASIFVPCA